MQNTTLNTNESTLKTTASSTRTAGTPHRKRVLIVDDDVEFSALLASHLKKLYGVQVAIVESAYGAMDELMERSYDLVVLDWDMNGVNGFAALQQVDRALNLDDRLPLGRLNFKVPVVMLSAHEPEKLNIVRHQKRHFRISKILCKRLGMGKICAALKDLLRVDMPVAV